MACSGSCCCCTREGLDCLGYTGCDDYKPATAEQIIKRIQSGKFCDHTQSMIIFLKMRYDIDYDCNSVSDDTIGRALANAGYIPSDESLYFVRHVINTCGLSGDDAICKAISIMNDKINNGICNEMRIERAIDLIRKERERQILLFGDQSKNQPFEWMSILGEEVGELCESVNETYFKNARHPERGGKEKIIKEATHVGAVAMAILEAMMEDIT